MNIGRINITAACRQIKQRQSIILSLTPWPVLLDYYTTWHRFARVIIERAREKDTPGSVKTETLLSIASSEYLICALRPQYSQLDSISLMTYFDVNCSDW